MNEKLIRKEKIMHSIHWHVWYVPLAASAVSNVYPSSHDEAESHLLTPLELQTLQNELHSVKIE